MSPFEIVMLICFGLAWPFSIHRSWKSRSSKGKSVVFLWVIVIGYICGTLHKILYSMDPVIALYMLNGCLVFVDILLYYRNSRLDALQEVHMDKAA